MRIYFDENDSGKLVSITPKMSIAEFLVMHEALKTFVANEDHNECDRKYAKRMLKDIRYEIDRCR
jgi:hypothetical protein